MSMTVNEWMAAVYGLERNDDAMRCRIGHYVRWRSPNPLRVDMICGVLNYTEDQVRSELRRIIRRMLRYSIPYKLIWDGDHTVTLIEEKK